MKSLKLKENESVKNDIAALYLSAFPENERPPLEWYFSCIYRYKENEAIAYYENDEFIGYSSLVTYQDIVYICYLAVVKEKRNRGYGSKILSDIKEKYQDKTILLCYEEVDEKYEDFLNRKNRENFYKRNGFINNELKTQEGEVVYQSARIGNRKVTFEDYKILFDLCYGKGANEKYLKEYK